MTYYELPTFRAKSLIDNEYIFGNIVLPENGKTYIIDSNKEEIYIDRETISINFPYMKDKDDTPIFASLREDGKYGDICNVFGHMMPIARIYQGSIGLWNEGRKENVWSMDNFINDGTINGIKVKNIYE